MELKKYILKTAFTTLVLCFFSILFIFNIAALFFPAQAAAYADALNIARLSLPLSKNAYTRGKNINDLAVLIERAVKYGDCGILGEYIPKLKNSAEYEDFAAYKNRTFNNSDLYDSDYKSYIDGNYLIALYNTQKYADCLYFCSDLLIENYSAHNPVRFLVRHIYLGKKNYPELNELLKQKYGDEKTSGASAETLKNLCVDIYSLYLGAGDDINVAVWRNEFQNINEK